VEISVYLKRPTSIEEAQKIADRVQQRRDVAAVDLVPAEAALKEFRRSSGFGDAMEALKENPLPLTLIVRPKAEFATAEHLESLASDIRQFPSAEIVQLDTAWVTRLHAILDAVRRAVLLAAGLLGLGVVVIVGNTIRLDIQNRRAEIEVTKLVGGSDAFVRRPFLYSGMWYGLGGAILAWVLSAVVVGLLRGPVNRIAGLYGSGFEIRGLGLEPSLILLAAGVVLGWIGSFVAASRHLREPS
jgi:cell division transport system permease protein